MDMSTNKQLRPFGMRDKIGYAFDKAADVLRECGFSYYAVFKNRRPVFHKL